MRTVSYAVAALLAAASVVSAQDVKVLASQTLEKSDRAVLGISTVSGGPRDTIGVLVSDVTIGSPADKAGIQEGDRVVSIGDVDLRLAPADAGDSEMRGIMGRRLAHAIARRAPGDVVELKVYHDGQFVTRKVTTGKASEVFVMPAVKLGALDQEFGPGTHVWLQRSGDEMHLRLPGVDSDALQLPTYDGGSRHRI
jgi:S1-C subfamily serine protease